MEITAVIIAAVLGIGAGAGGIFAYNKKRENGGKNKADDIIRKAKHEASDIVLEAKKEAAGVAEKSKQEEGRQHSDKALQFPIIIIPWRTYRIDEQPYIAYNYR